MSPGLRRTGAAVCTALSCRSFPSASEENAGVSPYWACRDWELLFSFVCLFSTVSPRLCLCHQCFMNCQPEKVKAVLPALPVFSYYESIIIKRFWIIWETLYFQPLTILSGTCVCCLQSRAAPNHLIFRLLSGLGGFPSASAVCPPHLCALHPRPWRASRTVPFYPRDASILRFWYLRGSGSKGWGWCIAVFTQR